MSIANSSQNELVSHYEGLATDDLVTMYKSGDLTEYINNIIAEILQHRNIDTEKIDRLKQKPVKPPKDLLLDYIGYAGFVFGIIAPILFALYEVYLWMVVGNWPAYSTLDMLYYFDIIDQNTQYYVYFEHWLGVTAWINRIIRFIMELSPIITLSLLGFIIFEFVDVLHTLINKKRNFKK